MSDSPVTRVPVAAAPAYVERVQQLPSRFTATLRVDSDNRVSPTAVAVYVGGDKVGYLPADLSRQYYDGVKAAGDVDCQGRHAPVSAHEDTGVDLLLDLSGVPRE